MRALISALCLCLPLLLSGCSGSNTPNTTTTDETAVDGRSTDHVLASDVDGAAIAFTVHQPTRMVPGQRYPLLIHSHGFGGSREKAAARGAFSEPMWQALLDQGYGMISVDQRGFGESGGKVRILDPYFEGQDLLQVLDWAEANLPWLQYRDGNVVLGAVGGSYGGGYQHLIYAIDPKLRLDALLPEITWYDLRASLYPNGVFKSYWATLLSAAGNVNARRGGGLDPVVVQGLGEGLSSNRLSEASLALLYQNSLVSYCEGRNRYAIERLGNRPLTKIDAMYWQGPADTLFPLNEQQKNVECLRALGGDVRLITKNQGHDSAGAGGETCGRLRKTQAYLDWFDEKLKGERGKASAIPRHCYQLNGSADDGVVTEHLPQPTQTFSIPATTLVAQEGSTQTVSIPLIRIGEGGAVLAGLPRVRLSLRDPSGEQRGDPIVFLSLVRRSAGATSDTALFPHQVQPFRGWVENLDAELVGLSNRLAPGDELRLLVSAAYAPRFARSGSVAATPVIVEGSVALPLLPGDLPAPAAN